MSSLTLGALEGDRTAAAVDVARVFLWLCGVFFVHRLTPGGDFGDPGDTSAALDALFLRRL